MSVPRSYSPVTKEAARLLGAQIQLERRTRRMPERELAERAGISVPTLRKIERGDLGVGIGLVLEVATLLAIPLFHEDRDVVVADLARIRDHLALLPASTRRPRPDVNDDF